jgi:hypothetical protein
MGYFAEKFAHLKKLIYSYALTTLYKPLFNGNVSSMAVNINALNAPKLYMYKYDQLNGLSGMDTWTSLDTTLND